MSEKPSKEDLAAMEDVLLLAVRRFYNEVAPYDESTWDDLMKAQTKFLMDFHAHELLADAVSNEKLKTLMQRKGLEAALKMGVSALLFGVFFFHRSAVGYEVLDNLVNKTVEAFIANEKEPS